MATNRRAQNVRSNASPDAVDARTATIFACGGLALIVARHVVPAESAHLGETLWIATAWLLLATGWVFLRLRGLGSPLRFDRGDLAIGLLVAGQVIAAIMVLATGGHRRAALNMLWEWAAVGIAVVLLRQWLSQFGRWPLLLRVLATAGIVLSGLGIWQFTVVYPAYRVQVNELIGIESRQADGTLSETDVRRLQELRAALGSLATERDPTVRYGLRQRLMASTEPLGCFALANTLAGVLVVALLLLLGGLATEISERAGMALLLRLAIPIALVAACLVLTKSRTAWVGLLCGLGVWGLMAARGQWMSRRTLRLVLIGLLLAAMLAGGAWAAGALDRLVLLEAPKSFRYRLEYWTGAWGVIRDHVWLGVGPGNFRQNYLRHKVAGSSEEVLDPHNLFLDVWANGGLIALAGLVFAVWLAVRRWRAIATNPESSVPVPAEPPNGAAIRRAALLCGVAGLGLVLLKSTIIELDWDARLAALLVGWVVTALWLPPLRIGKAPLVAAGVALGVHLLGAGGIAMPVVVATLLLLWLGPVDAVAASTDAADTDAAPGRRRALFGLMVCAVLVPACLVSSLVPVTLSSLYVAAATGAITARGDAATARRYLRNAIQADALDPQPWVYLAQLEYEAARQNRDAGSREWVNAIVQLTPAIELDPENSKSRWLLAQWKLEFAKRFPSPDAANEALQAAQQAADRDPQHAGIVATLAEAYAAANQPGEARNVAERALALDALNLELGHLDKLLDAKTRGELERIAGE